MENNLAYSQIHNVALTLNGLDQYGAFMAFSLRGGGVSPRPFDSLNFSAEGGDLAENVEQNLRILAERLGIDPHRIVAPRQVHGDEVVIIDAAPDHPPEADAIITASPGIYPAVKTADCVPLLLIDPVRRISAAVHVGWRGAVLRIARKVLRIMSDKLSCDPEDLIAGLGPAIGSCCYEVDKKVLKPLRENISEAERFIHVQVGPASLPANDLGKQPRVSTNSGKAFVDLPGVARFELISGGISEQKIHSVGLCASCRPDLFFSHRRDKGSTGRHIAIAGFKSA
jgi:polyphenol oxidase